MNIETFLSLLSSIGVSAATAAWLSRTIISHQLKKDLEIFKSELERNRDADKAAVEGRIREQVEASLGDLSAQRQYVLDARKRLYTAIGPLRFQLLLACRDLAGRVQSCSLGRAYELALEGYYGRSTLFRILRPICLAELVERQIAYADFAIDSGAVDLLRFKKSAFAAFSGGSLVEGHPNVDWNHQVQHVFYDHISRCANMLIVEEGEGQARAMYFHEFEKMFNGNLSTEGFVPFSNIFDNLSPEAKPLFWLRLVAFGYLCNDFINRTGQAIGFEHRTYPVGKLLEVTHDQTIFENMAEYVRRCDLLLESPL